jgi:hopanoid biosynthesis associated RND transporter like protein HpnN
MTEHQGSVSAFLRENGLTRLAALVLNWPRAVLAAAALLTVASCWLIATRMEMKTAHSDLISEKDRSAAQFQELMEEFGTPYVLIGVLECEPAQFSARRDLAARMKRELEAVRVPAASLDLGVAVVPGAMTNLVKGADYRLDLSSLQGRELYLASTNDLADIRKTLEQEAPWLRKLSATPTLEGFFRMADERFASEQKRGKVGSDAEAIQGLEMFAQLFDRMRLAATDSAWRPPEGSFWEEMFTPPSAGGMSPELREGYFASFDGRLLFMFIQPTSNSRNVDVLRKLVDEGRAAFNKVRQSDPKFADIKLALTGEPAGAVSEADSTSQDMQFFGAVSLVGVSILLMVGFRGFRFPLMLVASLGVGMAWTFGLTTLLIGHLNLLSQVVPIILIGLGMDFGIHLLARYREQRRRGSSRPEALREAVVQNGMSIIMSAITTAVAFFSISVDNFKGFVEMGLVAGMGVMCCLVTMIVVLPALQAMQRRFHTARDAELHPSSIPAGVDAAEPLHPPFVEKFFQYPWWILAVGTAITVALVVPTVKNWERISFDYNLASLSAPGTESVVYEARMMKESDFTADTVSLICKDLKAAEEITRRVQALPSVKKVESLHSRFLGDVAEKQATLNAIAPHLAGVFDAPPAQQPVAPPSLAAVVGKLAERLDSYQEMALDGGQKALVKPIGNALAAAKKFQKTLQSGDANLAARLGKFQDYFIGDLAKQLARFRTGLKSGPITLETVPKDLRDQFIGKTGKVQVMVYPKGELWNRPALTKFLTECRSLGVPVTGPPVEYYEMTKLMREGFDKAAIYACVAVYLLLLVDFRRFKAATLTMVPDLLGTVWMVGLMGLCGMSFNPANLMVLPLIIGIGLANGVHVMHRFREARDADISHVVWHTGLAVMLGSLVTVVGFGCLGLAHNLGIASIGKALTLGVGARIFTSIVILPAMLVIVQRRKWKV